MVDLKAKPFYLEDPDIRWIEDTIGRMSLDEKIGQLFINLGSSREEPYLKEVLSKYHIGGARYNPGSAAQIQEQNRILQENSKIPLLIAANTEAGGDGACIGGTEVGQAIKIAATNDPHYGYEMGRISGIEASAVGCNWSFAPIVDILKNWHNPIISSRAFSGDPDKVLAFGLEFLRGMKESHVACAMKHFPGDGIDERDHHLSSSVNSLSCEEWDDSFGKVYSGMIEAGVPSVMVGHIMLPSYQKKFNPDMGPDDLMPASLSKELVTGLLKGQLGFNGLVVTDASHMVGMTGRMKRSDFVPRAIAAGCDMFLFFNDFEEDFRWMKEGYEKGVITEERLSDALHRILGMKAMLGLHKKAKTDLVPAAEALSVVGCEEHRRVAHEVADRAITLVKNRQKGLLPISPERTKRILLVPQKGAPGLIEMGGKKAEDILKPKLEALGFVVEVFESVRDRIEKLPPEERMREVLNVYAGKASIESFVSKYDLIIHVADVSGTMMSFQRILWGNTKGTADLPWYVHEIPTIFVSVCCPFHLADVPQVQTYINCYDKREDTLEALVEKLTGNSEFTGVSPVDAFCGYPDTRL